MSPDEYRKMAAVEDTMWYYRALHRHVRRCLELRLQPGRGEVLDAGCGTGGLLQRLHEARPGWRLRGVDFSPEACALARDRGGAEISEASILALPFRDGEFDAVVSCDVICQVEDEAAALRELVRCTKPGGVIVLTMPAYAWMYSYHDATVGNRRRYTRGEVVALLRTAGLSVAWSTYWNTLPFPLAVLRRKLFSARAGTSDVRLYPAPLEAIFGGMMALEYHWFRAGWTLPFGSSVLAVGRKPE
ncbi:MAG: class I SAM-dependent methyltransferase [Opitutaceae bacterium]|nr:class I SAM-dependent methyltransferase [Opitutaceae bacterium]